MAARLWAAFLGLAQQLLLSSAESSCEQERVGDAEPPICPLRSTQDHTYKNHHSQDNEGDLGSQEAQQHPALEVFSVERFFSCMALDKSLVISSLRVYFSSICQ